LNKNLAGRLGPLVALIDAARSDAVNLGSLLAEGLPALGVPAEEMARRSKDVLGESQPEGLGGGGVVVWRDVALFAVSSARPPTLSLDGGEALPMALVSGTPYWFRLATIEPGRLHIYRYGVEGDWAPGGDFAGFNERSYELPDARRGTISDRHTVSSVIYPGAVTEYWLYANHGIDEVRGAPLMVWHDGSGCLEPTDLFGFRMQLVTDNLVHLGLIPPMVHVLVSPSSPGEELPTRFPGEDQANAMRSLQYDTVSDRYGRHLVEEVLPDAERAVKLRPDAYSRGSAGASSGGICAFKLAWFQPEQFSRVHSIIGSFTGLQWDPERGLAGGFMLSNLVRREPKQNVRVWIRRRERYGGRPKRPPRFVRRGQLAAEQHPARERPQTTRLRLPLPFRRGLP
jgi:hypothetical protein